MTIAKVKVKVRAKVTITPRISVSLGTRRITPLSVPPDTEFKAFVNAMSNAFANFNGPVFTTDAEGLFEIYLKNIPADDRQHHTCHACRRFIDTYGALVAVADDGTLFSPYWNVDAAPEYYRKAVRAVIKAVLASSITGIFKNSQAVLGQPTDGGWSHFAAANPGRWLSKTQSASQYAAEKLEDYKNVRRALGEYKEVYLKQAVELLKAEALYRSEKVLGQAEWLLKLSGIESTNLLWREIATAPAGFCHPRASMIGTLLDDLVSGMSLASVKKRFDDKMQPNKYMRPVAAPAAQTIVQAEALVEKLGIASALRRRYARLEDLELLWTPSAAASEPAATPSVFGHLKKSTTVEIGAATTMTWSKFRDKVLPRARRIQYYTGIDKDVYGAYVTAVDRDAPLIFQWNNAVSRFLFTYGSSPSTWNLHANVYVDVTGISLASHMWGGEDPKHHGVGALFALKNAKCTMPHIGSALFPENLKSELHGVRSVFEAHSKATPLEGREEATACGLVLSTQWDREFRVTTDTGVSLYKIDRWD